MMSLFPNHKIISILFLLVLFISCQKEETTLIDDSTKEEKLVANSELTNLIFRVTQNPTSIDNVLDKSNCVSINLPVGVFVDGVLFSVGSANGMNYQQMQDYINQQPTTPSVVMDFPITVTKQDYSTVPLPSQSAMNSVISTCTSNGLADITCAKIVYPISIAMYNVNNQVASTLTIQNNQQFYSFLDTKLSDAVIANINYPITLKGSDNQNSILSTNLQLENFIRNAADNCD